MMRHRATVVALVFLAVASQSRADAVSFARDAHSLITTLGDWTSHEGTPAAGASRCVSLDNSYPPATKEPTCTRHIDRLIMERSRAHGVNPNLMRALVRAESAFRPAAVSHAGAIGLCQLMPVTARELGVNPWDPAQNVDGGARYFRMLLSEFRSPVLALIGYNAGPAVVRERREIPLETVIYVQRVLRFFVRYEGGDHD